MSIQKKSLISTLKTAKKANVASSSAQEVDSKGAKVSSMRLAHGKQVGSAKVGHMRSSQNSMKSAKFQSMKKK